MIPGIVLTETEVKWGGLINGEFFVEGFDPKEGYDYDDVTQGEGGESFFRQLDSVAGTRLGAVTGYVVTVERLTMRKRINIMRAAKKANVKIYGMLDGASAACLGMSLSYNLENGTYLQFWIHDGYGYFDLFTIDDDYFEMYDKRYWRLALQEWGEPDLPKLRMKLRQLVSAQAPYLDSIDYVCIGDMPGEVRDAVKRLFPRERILDDWDEDLSILLGTLNEAGKVGGAAKARRTLLLNCSPGSISIGDKEVIPEMTTIPEENTVQVGFYDVRSDGTFPIVYRDADIREPELVFPVSVKKIWDGDFSATASVKVAWDVDTTFSVKIRNVERREELSYDWKELVKLIPDEAIRKPIPKKEDMPAKRELPKEEEPEIEEIEETEETEIEEPDMEEAEMEEPDVEEAEIEETAIEEPEESEEEEFEEESEAEETEEEESETEEAVEEDAEAEEEETEEADVDASDESEEETSGESEEQADEDDIEFEFVREASDEEPDTTVFDTEQELEFDPDLFTPSTREPVSADVTAEEPEPKSEPVREKKPEPEPEPEPQENPDTVTAFGMTVRSRAAKQAAEMEEKHATEKRDMLKKVLPVVDCLDFGLMNTTGTLKAEDIRDGLQATKKKMLGVLAELGVTPIPAENVPFDVNLHEAVSHVESEDYPESWVVQEVQSGFMYNGKVLRYSKVVVAN